MRAYKHPASLHWLAPHARPPPSLHLHSRRLTLTTRYYTAAIELVALPAAAYLAPAPGAALAAALPPGAPPAEALVLVLDGAQPLDGAALAAASAWAARCAEAALATLLVVSVGCAHLGGGGSGAPPSAATAAHLAAAQAWALDHGFEHVEALCSQPALGAAGREKFSVPRVLEALEATLWGCAVMHAPSAARAGAQVAAAGGGSGDAAAILDSAARLGGEGGGGAEGGGEEGGAGEEEGEAEAAGAEQRGYRAPELYGSAGGGGGAGGVTLEGEEVEALRAAMQALLPAGAGDEGGSGGAGSSSGSAARPAQGAAAAAAAAAASQFEGLLGQALSIRNAAKDGSMSDAARREAASAMMEKLMAALGLEGEDEEGEGEEGAGLGAAIADGAAAAPGK